MNVLSLCSGGKDSLYALWLSSEEAHDVTGLATMIPERSDSWMFHRPDSEIMKLISEASGIPLVVGETEGVEGEELEDLRALLEGVEADGVVSGAVASNYQRDRIVEICDDLDLEYLFPLWGDEPLELLEGMLEDGFEIIITSVSAQGLDSNWLGRRIDGDCIEDLEALHGEFGIHVTGEGGEYETLVLDAPFFDERIDLVETERVWRGDRGHLKIKGAELNQK